MSSTTLKNSSPKTAIITQARMTSTRLPGKVLKELAGKPLLSYHVDRLSWSGLPVIVATTVNDTDQPVIEFCDQRGLSYFRGSEDNVLSRFYLAAEKYDLDTVVRVTSDCPLIDGHLIREAVEAHLALQDQNLYTSNVIQRTFPRGFDFEIFSFARLKEAFQNATLPGDREHVTPYLHQNRDGRTHFKNRVDSENMSPWRLTVDVPEDFELIRRLIEELSCASKTYAEIKTVLHAHPQLQQINQHIEQKKN